MTNKVHNDHQARAHAAREGMYQPSMEHDACGVALLADIHGRATHELVRDALTALERMEHRGAKGRDPYAGDGAGILMQLPHGLLSRDIAGLSEPGTYGVGMVFLPTTAAIRSQYEAVIHQNLTEKGFHLLGWRDVPTRSEHVGTSVISGMPVVRQFVVTCKRGSQGTALERRLIALRRGIERAGHHVVNPDPSTAMYLCTLSSRTIVYKGLLVPERLSKFYPDLDDELTVSAVALVHQRFSTNTSPSWARAHPYRWMAHNGEINTLRGNVNWMRAREHLLLQDDEGTIIDTRGSDSAMFDNALEAWVNDGRSLPHAIAMMMPPAWEQDAEMPEEMREFFAWHAALSEPWDGPACVVFTDGTVAGAALDRNGLRPSRFVRTRNGRLLVSSETGVLTIRPEDVVEQGRLQPGGMLLADLRDGTLRHTPDVHALLRSNDVYKHDLARTVIAMDALPDVDVPPTTRTPEQTALMLAAHGTTLEDLKHILLPMVHGGEEAVGSMGNDTPLAALSKQPRMLFEYFRQLFAQVTNPPIDPIREERVMSLRTWIGRAPAPSIRVERASVHDMQIVASGPVLESHSWERMVAWFMNRGACAVLGMEHAPEVSLREALDSLCTTAVRMVREGNTVLVLAHTDVEHAVPISSLLATAAVHLRLVREGLRTQCALAVKTADAREIHHIALLIGYGATVIHPMGAFAAIDQLHAEGNIESLSRLEAHKKFIKACHKGLLKVMSKMGISTLQSYRGAQIFEAIGLSPAFVDESFQGTALRPGRVDLAHIEQAARARWTLALERATSGEYNKRGLLALAHGGLYQWRRDGESHAWNPDAVSMLQHAVRSADETQFRKYTAKVDAQAMGNTVRGLLRTRVGRTPVPLDEVEHEREIVKRFKTGAMSFGSISREAHETLALAMNQLGGRSNSGEGGEDPARYIPDTDGRSRRSAIKQIASGRFGVTSHYLVNASELQIKMAQGAKPGEGGQLPGHKVDPTIARIRLATAGVGLISPPPHHDIYSIEDLAQLIYDLKCANDKARVSVKLVSEPGVGTVAAGVAKAGADVIVISGDSGGTGAAPLGSIKHAGEPWEFGLAEAHQTLQLNGLRGRVRLETDGQLKTARDVVMGALLGAEEFGFATAALIAAGCVMMRVCHLNTCPVGIATQDPELRKRFVGEPEHVINFMVFLAREVREILASLGFRRFEEIVGRTDLLESVEAEPMLDVSRLLYRVEHPDAEHGPLNAKTGPSASPDDAWMQLALRSALRHEPFQHHVRVNNTDRTLGARLSAEISRTHGAQGLSDEAISLSLEGTAGQSFGAFLAPGVQLKLEGEANDYVGKGLSGGRIVIVPSRTLGVKSPVLCGNVALYGASAGELFLAGRAGERFAVRNSGAVAVVEGVGDHGCEYMTRGTVLVLGRTGRNFAAGMSGGVAYVLDLDNTFASRCNTAMVALEAVEEEDLVVIRRLLARHIALTDSTHARTIQNQLREITRRIVKVMPMEFRKALQAARATGSSSQTAQVQ